MKQIIIVSLLTLACFSNSIAVQARTGAAVFDNTKNFSLLISGIDQNYADSSNPLRVSASSKPVTYEYALYPGEDVNEKIKGNIFVKAEPSRTNCSQYEIITLNFRLYSRMVDKSQISRFAMLPGFSFHTVNSEPGYSVAILNNQTYKVTTIQSLQLVPLSSGKLTIDPIEIESKLEFIKKARRADRSGLSIDALMDEVEQEASLPRVTSTIHLSSDPVSIRVAPTPPHDFKPGFTGAVGRFTLADTLMKTVMKTGETNELRIIFSGSGYLPAFDPPILSLPAGLSPLDVINSEELDDQLHYEAAVKTFGYRFIPEKPGEYSIPSISISFYDPARHKFLTLKTHSYKFNVAAGAAPKPVTREENDKPAKDNTKKQSIPVYWINAIVFGLLVLAYVFARVRSARRKRLEAVKKAKELEEDLRPPDPLETALLLAQNKKYRECLIEVQRSLMDSISAKLPTSIHPGSTAEMFKGLLEKGFTSELVTEAKNIFDECETNLYMPGLTALDLDSIISRTRDLLARLGDG